MSSALANPQSFRKKLHAPETRQEAIIEFADFFRDLCLAFGADFETSSRIHYEICVGLQRDLRNSDAR